MCIAYQGGKNSLPQIEGTSYDASKLQRTQPYTYSEGVNAIKEAIVNNGPNSIRPIEVRVHNGVAPLSA